MTRTADAVFAITLAIAVAGVFLLLEIGLAIAPGWQVYAVVGLATAGLLVLLLRSRPRYFRGLLLLAFLLTLFLLHTWPWNPRKTFRHDLARVIPGMTVGEVESIMGGYLRGTGWPAKPLQRQADFEDGETLPVDGGPELVIQGALTFRHSQEGRFDSDWGVVFIRDGKAVRVEFLPD